MYRVRQALSPFKQEKKAIESFMFVVQLIKMGFIREKS